MKTLSLKCGQCDAVLKGTVKFPDSVPDLIAEEKARAYMCANCQAALLVAQAVPPKRFYSKLAIRRVMREQGTEAQLDALISGSSTFGADWHDAQEIDLEDPVLLAALSQSEIDIAPVIAALQ